MTTKLNHKTNLSVSLENLSTEKYIKKQRELKFTLFLAIITNMLLRGTQKVYNTKWYQALGRLRKKLKIPRKTYEPIPLELRDEYPNIPEWAFGKYTTEEKLKFTEKQIKEAGLPIE